MGNSSLAPGGTWDPGDSKFLLSNYDQFPIVGCDDPTLSGDNYATDYDLGAWAKAGAPRRKGDSVWLCMDPQRNITLSGNSGSPKYQTYIIDIRPRNQSSIQNSTTLQERWYQPTR